jgi:hypothetical protein
MPYYAVQKFTALHSPTTAPDFKSVIAYSKRNAYRVLVEKPEGKRLLVRPRHRWKDNINMGLREIRWGGLDWIHLAQDRDQWRALVNTVMNLRVP